MNHQNIYFLRYIETWKDFIENGFYELFESKIAATVMNNNFLK